MGYAYVIYCRFSTKSYIGITTQDLHKRWIDHKSMARKYKNKLEDDDTYFGYIKLYEHMLLDIDTNFSNFYMEMLDDVPLKDDGTEDINTLNELEVMYSEAYEDPEDRLNTRVCGTLNPNYTPEVCAKISEKTKEAFNKPEVIEKIRKKKAELNGLPPKCGYGINNGLSCYRIRRHANIPDKCFYISDAVTQVDAKLALATYINSYIPNLVDLTKI